MVHSNAFLDKTKIWIGPIDKQREKKKKKKKKEKKQTFENTTAIDRARHNLLLVG